MTALDEEYVYNPLSRATYEAIAFNAVGRASEVNNLSAYGLSHSTGNSGWSVGFMQWDFGQPGRGARADDMLTRYQQWAPESQRFGDAELDSLSRRLQTRGQVGNALTVDERSNLNGFLRSDEGRAFVGELDAQQVERKWIRIGQPLSEVQWIRDLSEIDPEQVAEIVAMTSKLYNQNEIRGSRLIQHLQDNTLTSAQTGDWIGTDGIEGLNPAARAVIVSGRDKALVGARLMNALETGDGQISRMWRDEVHGNGNVGLTINFNTNASVQLLDKVMRDPVNGGALRAQLEGDAPARRILMEGGAAETARVELDRAGELTVRSPNGVESVLTPAGWIRRPVQDREQPGQGLGGRHQGEGEQPRGVQQRDPQAHNFPGNNRDYPLFAAIRQQLPDGIADEKLAFIVLQAKQHGINHVDRLDKVLVHEGSVWISGKTIGEWAKVDLSSQAPSLQDTLRQSETIELQRTQQFARDQQEDRHLNQAAQEQGSRTRTLG